MFKKILRHPILNPSRRKKLASEAAAKAAFAEKLATLLARPEPDQFACGCCGHEHRLAELETLHAKCLFTQQELKRYRCTNCEAVFGPVPLIECKPEELGGLYESLYEFYHEGASNPFQEKTFYLLNPSRRGTYLNYACGDWTRGVAHLRALGWDVRGYEPFQEVASEAISTRDNSKDPYDGVMTHNYIEHVQDPQEFFMRCSELVAEGGKMAHSSACYDYVYEVSPFHLFFPCGDSVRFLAQRTGFEVLDSQRVDQDFPGHQYVCYVFRKVSAAQVRVAA